MSNFTTEACQCSIVDNFMSWLRPTNSQTRLDLLRVVGVFCNQGIACPTTRMIRVVMCVVCSGLIYGFVS